MTALHRHLVRAGARALGLGLGLALDALVGDPPNRLHPVAWFGSAVARLERATYTDDRAAGTRLVAMTVLPLAVAGAGVDHLTRNRPLARVLTTAGVTWVCVGRRSLSDEGRVLADRLASADLTGAREQLTHLCGRDPDDLDEPEIARAAVESMAENTSDAVVGSLFWGGATGLGGMLTHRALNTLDAMVGHHNDRYERFGWCAAVGDDAANLLPARLTGLLTVAVAPLVGGSSRDAWRVMRRDAHAHPSPNGGWCESAFAGALGVQLGGRNVYYGGRVEDRGLLGDGPRPDAIALRRAAALVGHVSLAALGVVTAGLVAAAPGRNR